MRLHSKSVSEPFNLLGDILKQPPDLRTGFSCPEEKKNRSWIAPQSSMRGKRRTPPDVLSLQTSSLQAKITKHFVRYLKWRNPHLSKLYGYGLCKDKTHPQKSRSVAFLVPETFGDKIPPKKRRPGASEGMNHQNSLQKWIHMDTSLKVPCNFFGCCRL